MPPRAIPNDYDGVVAHYPAYNVTLLHLGSLNAGRAGVRRWWRGVAQPGQDEADHRRGLREVRRPRWREGRHHQPGQVMQHRVRREDAAMANGADGGDTCLSDAQLAAVAKITSDYKPGFAVAGMDTFPRWPLLEGALFRERSNWGEVPQPSNPLSGKEPLLYTPATRRRSSSSAATRSSTR